MDIGLCVGIALMVGVFAAWGIALLLGSEDPDDDFWGDD